LVIFAMSQLQRMPDLVYGLFQQALIQSVRIRRRPVKLLPQTIRRNQRARSPLCASPKTKVRIGI